MANRIDSSAITNILRRRTIAAYYCSNQTAEPIREGHLSSGQLTGYLERYMLSGVCLNEKTGTSFVPSGPPYPITYTIFDGLGADNSAAMLTLDNTDPVVITYDGGSS